MYDTVRRIRSSSASTAGELAGNRIAAFGGTVGIGGSVAHIVLSVMSVPPDLAPHVSAVVIFLVQTGLFFLGKRLAKG
jgi:hypothetical protein